MSSKATFEVLETGDVWVGVLEGDIDVSNATDLGEQIIESVSNEPSGLVLDISKISYLDSSGVGLLFALVRTIESRRQRLVLVLQDSSPLNRLFVVTHLDSVVPIRPTRQEAKLLAHALERDSHPA